MNFVLFENENGKETFMWEKELENLPNDTITFTHYQQDNVDKNGMIQSSNIGSVFLLNLLSVI